MPSHLQQCAPPPPPPGGRLPPHPLLAFARAAPPHDQRLGQWGSKLGPAKLESRVLPLKHRAPRPYHDTANTQQDTKDKSLCQQCLHLPSKPGQASLPIVCFTLHFTPCPQEVPPRGTLCKVQFGSGASGCSAARSHWPVRLLCPVTNMYTTSSSAQTSVLPGCEGCRPTHMLVTLSLWLVTAMYIDSGAPQPRRGHMEPV